MRIAGSVLLTALILGGIRLIVVYRDETSGTLFHFQQLEQLGL